MIPGKEYPSRYFNGKSAIPEEGVAVIQNTNFQFTSENLTHKIPIQNFTYFDFVPHGCKLTLNPDEVYESPVLEIFCTKEEAKTLESVWFQHKKTTGFFHKIIYNIKEINPVLTITVAGCLFVVFGFVYYLGLLNIYRLVPTSVDESIGSMVHKKIESGIGMDFCEAKEAEEFLTKATEEIRPKDSPYKYSIQIISRPDTNAFAVSGGKIYFLSGLLNKADSQEEVLGVLAHEIAHVEKRHHVRNLLKALGTAFAISILVGPGLGDFEMIETASELGTTILVLKFSRDFESEADEYAVQLLKDANLSLTGLYSFFEKLQRDEKQISKAEDKGKNSGKDPEEKKSTVASKFFDFTDFLSTHPGTEERIATLKKLIGSEKKKRTRQLVSQSQWKKIKNSCLPKSD
ncbi:M48 family metallopeptidase [Leptospira idonii]|uniref:M48 family metallopeptidase n=1 Tax=Leptospira idonii TaxID=1193500 RepID=A0A4R9LW42_9LEPT|nr:M48 family metallopeptidase [Leptospira idonii]TGN17127.1 M48 family metallopeptidase [Leptospira idonii]